MMADEKIRLLALLMHPVDWCQGAEARDRHERSVRFDDADAVAWDVTGGLCRLFGWPRACLLFEQIERHLGVRRRFSGNWMACPSIDAMRVLQDFNDRPDTTFADVRGLLETMPVWRSEAQAPAGVGGCSVDCGS